jgi:hypothetical protein
MIKQQHGYTWGEVGKIGNGKEKYLSHAAPVATAIVTLDKKT